MKFKILTLLWILLLASCKKEPMITICTFDKEPFSIKVELKASHNRLLSVDKTIDLSVEELSEEYLDEWSLNYDVKKTKDGYILHRTFLLEKENYDLWMTTAALQSSGYLCNP